MSVSLSTPESTGSIDSKALDTEINDWLFESSPDCVKIIDLGGNVLAMNRNGMCSMEIDDFTTVCGKPWLSLWSGEARSAVSSSIAQAIAGGTGHFSAFGATVKGTPKWWDVIVTPVRDQQGEIVKLLSVSRDVTAVHQAREMAENSAARFRTVVKAVSAIVWVTPPSGAFESEQPEWSAFTGQTFTEMKGSGWLNAVHPDDRAATVAATRVAQKSVAAFVVTHRLRRADGQYRHMSVQVVPVIDADGTLREWVGVHTDVTSQKLSEDALQKSTREIAEADRRKTEFIVTLAHELRNPLAPIRNGLQIMKMAADNPETIARVRNVIERQVGQMVHLIDDLLDVARISRGQVELKKQLVELNSIATNAVETSLPVIEAGHHDLTLDLGSEALPLYVDPARMAQVLSNLLNNAAKYTPQNGRIVLSATRDGQEAVITVTDSGIGIPPESLPMVFDMFAQVDEHKRHAQGGLGIGLSLVRNLVEMHGGSVSANSAGVGSGSSFTVRLPLALAGANP